MSKTNWTPGPWQASRNSAYWEVIPVNKGKDGVPWCVGDVCQSCPGDADSGLQEANAHLIAAAPELYEALIKLIDSYKQLAKDYEYASGAGDLHPIHLEYIARSKQALAKARGE